MHAVGDAHAPAIVLRTFALAVHAVGDAIAPLKATMPRSESAPVHDVGEMQLFELNRMRDCTEPVHAVGDKQFVLVNRTRDCTEPVAAVGDSAGAAVKILRTCSVPEHALGEAIVPENRFLIAVEPVTAVVDVATPEKTALPSPWYCVGRIARGMRHLTFRMQ